MLGLSEPLLARSLREATFRAFDRMTDLAIEKRVDFICIAGDVYDSADRSLRAQLRFRDGLVRAAEEGITCFVTHGNHDPLSGWTVELRAPENVHRFGASVESFRIQTRSGEEVDVSGVSYKRRDVRENLSKLFRKEAGSPFSVGVLHCSVGRNPEHEPYAPCSIDDLRSSGIDYWALGHFHNRSVLSEYSPTVAYPGNTQGRNIKETEARGCYVVEVEDRDVRLEFVPLDSIRLFVREVDIGELASVDDFAEALLSLKEQLRAKSKGNGVVLRVVARGRGSLHTLLLNPRNIDDLVQRSREGEAEREDFVWIESVSLRTSPELDIDSRRKAEDFIGILLRQIEAMRLEPNGSELVRKLLLRNQRFRTRISNVQDYIRDMNSEELRDLLDRAESLLLDYLLPGEE